MKSKLYVFIAGIALSATALAADPQVEIRTNMGAITLELYADKAPKTVANFLQYVEDGHFKGTIFHRVIPDFMVQGGGFNVDFVQKKTRPPVQNEADNGLKNDIGTVAMARTSDPHSATAQFFINHKNNEFLNFTAPTQRGWGYTVFGKVIKGIDVVNKIAVIETGPMGPFPSDVPRKTVVIEDAKAITWRAAGLQIKGNDMVKLHTNHGIITLDLDAARAPVTVENFLNYVNSGHFNNTIFHRVINGFMIQGGGFEPGMKQKPTAVPIKNEADNTLKNDNYTVAMARTSDPHSASAQFFINVGDNAFLNHTAPTTQGWGYCVFGKVIEGKEVVDQIKAVKTGNRGGHQDAPAEDVVIEKAEVV